MLLLAQVTKIVATKDRRFYQNSAPETAPQLMKIQRLSQQASKDAKQIAPPGTGLIKTRLSSSSKEKLLLAFHPLLLPSPKILIITAIDSFKSNSHF